MTCKAAAECFLRCVAASHPDIPLPHLVPVSLGRGPVTKVTDTRCSRTQLCLVANTTAYTVRVTQRGMNGSTVRGEVLGHGREMEAGHGDTMELLTGAFPHTVIFSPPPKLEMRAATQSARVSSSTEKKREKPAMDGPRKKARNESADREEVPWMTGGAGRVIADDDGDEWRSVDDGKLLVGTQAELPGSDRIAAFDIDGTIITTQSGKVFPKDIHDWKILYSEVPGRLKKLSKDGFKIVFITNQAGIARGKMTVEEFRMKATRIREKLGVPLQVFVSTADKGFFRKPRTGIWNWLERHGNCGVKVDRSQSFYCGDAAGRDKDWLPGKKKDFSCSDRLLATNLGLRFTTPEEEFLGHSATSKFSLPGYLPGPTSLPLLEPTTASLLWPSLAMVMMVGIQGSGKSVVAALLEREDYVVASTDRTGSRDKTVRVAEQALKSGRSVVVDNTHVDMEARKPFLDLAQRCGVPVRCFLMATSHDHARHNNVYRELTDPSHARIKEPLFNQYRARFVSPTLEEGFKEIVKVNVVPEFDTKKHEALYNMHLLEK